MQIYHAKLAVATCVPEPSSSFERSEDMLANYYRTLEEIQDQEFAEAQKARQEESEQLQREHVRREHFEQQHRMREFAIVPKPFQPRIFLYLCNAILVAGILLLLTTMPNCCPLGSFFFAMAFDN